MCQRVSTPGSRNNGFAIFVEDVEARSGLSKKHGRKIHVQYSKHDDATEL